jgi:hypothetical protein
MLEYEPLKPLLQFLNVLKMLHKELNNIVRWTMQIAMKTTNQVVQYLSITCAEVTTIDTQSWINIHVYVVQDWAKVSILMSLEQITKGATANNLTKVIMEVATMKGG